jgi:hypothetical protein
MAWFDRRWQYRKSHVINSAAGAGTNYQIPIHVHGEIGSDSGNDVYLNGKGKSDYGDVRFTAADGITELDYWLDEAPLDDMLLSSRSVRWSVRFVGNYDRTYVCYIDSISVQASIMYYDHTLGLWASPVLLGSMLDLDMHRSPGMGIDSSGYIHVFYGPHADDSMWYQKSSNPEDISSWSVRVDVVNGELSTYPQVIVLSDDTILCFYRQHNGANRPIRYVKSDDGGSSWDLPVSVLDHGATFIPYFKVIKASTSDRIHLVWDIHYTAVGERRNIFYAYCDALGTWWNVDGSHSEAVISKAEADAEYLALSTEPDASYTYDIKDDSGENPYIGYYDDVGATINIKMLYWTGAVWQDRTVFSPQTNGKPEVFLNVVSSSDIYCYFAHQYNVEEYYTDDSGATWANTTHLTTNGVSDYCYAGHGLVQNSDNEVMMLYSKGLLSGSLYSHFYWYDADADTSQPVRAIKTFWVEVTGDLGAGNVRIYIYYGNAAASTTSDGDATFLDFDANDDLVQFNADWNKESGDNAALDADSHARATIKLPDTSAVTFTSYSRSISWPTTHDIVVRLYQALVAPTDYPYGGLYCYSASGIGLLIGPRGGAATTNRLYNGSNWTFGTFEETVMWWWDFYIDPVNRDALEVDIEDGDNYGVVKAYQFDEVLDEIRLNVGVGASLHTGWFGPLTVRKFTDPEPAHGAWGREYRVPRLQGFVM